MNGAERHVPGTTRKVQLQLLPLDEMLGSENFADGYTQLIVLCARLGLEGVLGQLRHRWPWQGVAKAVLESTNAFTPLPPWDTHDVQRASAWHSRHPQPSGE